MDARTTRQLPPVPPGPLEEQPEGAYIMADLRRQLLLRALRDIELGAYDRRLVDQAAQHLDSATFRAVLSLLDRTRMAGMLSSLDLQQQIHDRARRRPLDHVEPGEWGEAASGAGA
jgi:hypothetical protein